MNVKGHRRTDANQQSPHLLAPVNGDAGLVPVDGPITPANAINNTNLGFPGVPDRTAHLLKNGVVKIRVRTPARAPLCERLAILAVRKASLSTFQAIGIAALSAY